MNARVEQRVAMLMQQQCDRFNADHAIGDTIKVWPGAVRPGQPQEVTICAPRAVVLNGHTAVVYVTGGPGCVALTHVVRERAN